MVVQNSYLLTERTTALWAVYGHFSPSSAHKNVLHMEASDQKFLSSAKMFSFSRQKRPPLPMIIIDGLDPRRSTFYDQQLTSECLTKLAGRLEESFGSCCRFCRSQVTQCNVGQEHEEINAQEWAHFFYIAHLCLPWSNGHG